MKLVWLVKNVLKPYTRIDLLALCCGSSDVCGELSDGNNGVSFIANNVLGKEFFWTDDGEWVPRDMDYCYACL
jgi:hypothetical protein